MKITLQTIHGQLLVTTEDEYCSRDDWPVTLWAEDEPVRDCVPELTFGDVQAAHES